jgi:NhaP-type Na+/H+ or K+/H+ antiporter
VAPADRRAAAQRRRGVHRVARWGDPGGAPCPPRGGALQVGLVLLGLLVAAIGPRDRYEISPGLVLLVLHPGLVFWGAYQTDVTELPNTWAGIALLAVSGVLISAGLVAVVLHEFAGLPL